MSANHSADLDELAYIISGEGVWEERTWAVAQAIVSSDWLAARDAATEARVREQVASVIEASGTRHTRLCVERCARIARGETT